MNSLYDPDAIGQTYEALGPDRFTMNELFATCLSRVIELRRSRNTQIIELMLEPRVFAKCHLTGIIPFVVNYFNQLNIDRLERMSITDESQGLPNLTDLGVKLTKVADQMPNELI